MHSNQYEEKRNLIEMRGVCKSFPGVQALSNAGIELKEGEVHALLGENGAGKSTLMKILCGNYQSDAGEILINGKKVDITSPHSAQQLGIVMIQQEILMAENITVTENIFMGREIMKNKALGIMDYKNMNAEADKILNGVLGANIPVTTKTYTLSVAQKQLVEIAKAVSTGARVIVMDEPTSSLSNKDIQSLFELVGNLKAQGTCIVYISHRMEELYQICDRVTVMRDGKHIATKSLKEIDMETLIKLMVGRSLEEKYPARDTKAGDVALRVTNLNRKGILHDINLEARKGEVLGIFGLIGAKRTELAKAIFGADPIDSGTIEIFGEKVSIKSPMDAINKGIALIPEDRRHEGLVGIMSVSDNIALPILKKTKKLLLVDSKKQSKIANDYVNLLSVKTPNIYRPVRNLSGGNQQKVVISKWIASDARIIIFDEPTRGIDIGAKTEIYKIINQLLEQGVCVIMISSEMPELLGVSDRIMVMKAGRLVAEFAKNEATQEEILKCAL